jgi:hypothetical protein
LLSGSGHSFEQAVGMHFAMVPDAFYVLVIHLAKCHREIITLRRVFAQLSLTAFGYKSLAGEGSIMKRVTNASGDGVH